MATLNIPRYKAHGLLDAGYNATARALDFVVDLSKDVAMGSATDVINLAKLPGGAVIVSLLIQQVQAGTGTGTLEARVGTTSLTGPLLATAAAGSVSVGDGATTPAVVPGGGADLNLLGAVAARTTGKIRVVAVIVEGDREPRVPGLAPRDTSL